MPLSQHQSQVLYEIGEQLAAGDPRLARELTWPRAAPMSMVRELVVSAVLLGWMALGFVPLALGIAYSYPIFIVVGVLTEFIGGPVMFWATLRWVRRHRFVHFRESGER